MKTFSTLRTRIQENILSDGSKTYDVVMLGHAGIVVLECMDEQHAFDLQRLIDTGVSNYDVKFVS